MKKQGPEDTFDKSTFDDVLLRKMLVVPSFEIYGGVAGLYDFGPVTCALKANFINLWKQHFILEEDMLEVECTNLTPYCALKTSGELKAPVIMRRSRRQVHGPDGEGQQDGGVLPC